MKSVSLNFLLLLLISSCSIACRMLKEVEKQLSDFPFFVRVHNSYVVNIKEVKKYVRGEGGYVIMSDDTSVNVSRSRKEELLKWFKSSRF